MRKIILRMGIILLMAMPLIGCDAVDNSIKKMSDDNIDVQKLVELNGKVYYVDEVNSVIYKEIDGSFVDMPLLNWSKPIHLTLYNSLIADAGFQLQGNVEIHRNRINYTVSIEVIKDSDGLPVRKDYAKVIKSKSNRINLYIENSNGKLYEIKIPLSSINSFNVVSPDGKIYGKQYADSSYVSTEDAIAIHRDERKTLSFTYVLPKIELSSPEK